MQIALAQIQVEPDLQRLFQKLETCFEIAKDSRLIVFPEFFNTPFLLEEIEKNACSSKPILEYIQILCARYGMWCAAGSLAWKEEGNLYNRCFVVDEYGKIIGHYDKIHLLEVHSRHSFKEKDVIQPGDHLFFFEIDGITFGIVICYDIRFPELARIYGNRIDCLIVPAAFNEAVGKKHWTSLLSTRAMENQVYLIGVNPAYQDFSSYRSYGHSMVADPDGVMVLQMDGSEQVLSFELSKKRIDQIRSRSPYWKLRDEKLYLQLQEETKNESNSDY